MKEQGHGESPESGIKNTGIKTGRGDLSPQILERPEMLEFTGRFNGVLNTEGRISSRMGAERQANRGLRARDHCTQTFFSHELSHMGL